MKGRNFIWIFVLTIFLLSMSSVNAASYKDVTAEEALDMLIAEQELVVVDVSPMYDKGHLPRAVNHPVGDGSLDEGIPMLDRSKTYLVYCHMESASRSGAQKLVDAGFQKVYRIDGDYSAWVDAGYPVEK